MVLNSEVLPASVRPRTVTPGTVQRHISDGTHGQWVSASAQEKTAIAKATSGHTEMMGGLKNMRTGVGDMVDGFNALNRAMSQAKADPIPSPEEGSSGGGGTGGVPSTNPSIGT